MGTKQVQFQFQVVANDGVAATATISIDGVQKFSGPIAQTVEVMPNKVLWNETPYTAVTVDVDVPDQPIPPAEPPNERNHWVVFKNIVLSVTGGQATLQSTQANYTAALVETQPPTDPATYHTQPGTVSDFVPLQFGTTPDWTPYVSPSERDYEPNGAGPSCFLILDGETVTWDSEITTYSAA